MVINVPIVVFIGLDVVDQQKTSEGKAGDDKPTGGLHRDSNERGVFVADDQVGDLELVKEEPARLFTSCCRQLMFCLRFFLYLSTSSFCLRNSFFVNDETF